MAGRDHDYTVNMAEQLIERIKALGLPADPAAFELWYTYVSGRNAELNRRINRLIEDQGTVSPAEYDNIYDEFLAPSRTNSALGNIGTRLSAEVDNVVGMLGELILSTAQDREDFAHASNQLTRSIDRQAVRAIADALIKSLRAIELQHLAMEHRLIASKRELESVQHALTAVTAEANLDPVTGLATRRRFDSALEQATEAANKDGQPLSVLMIDIDHFKSFNDRFGHLMGDSVLRLIGVTLKQSTKGQDIAARYGGEDFSVILPETDLHGAAALAEQIRQRIISRELKRRPTGDSLGAITVSIGVATYRHGERPRTMLERADSSLYEAKHAGRNSVRCEEL